MLSIVFGLPLIFAQWIWFRTKWDPEFSLRTVADALPGIVIAVLVMVLGVFLVAWHPLLRSFCKRETGKQKNGDDE